MKSDRTKLCPSEPQLEAFWLAGRPADHPAREHLEGCPACQGRIAEMDRCRDVFLREVAAVTEPGVVDRVRAARAGRKSPWLSLPVWAASAAALALVLVLVVVLDWTRPTDDYIGIKGEVGVQVIARRGEQTFRVQPGMVLRPGDRLGFRVTPPSSGHLMIVVVDDRGEVGVAHPFGAERAVEVPAGEQAVPAAVVLDDRLGPERLFVLFSERTFDVGSVRGAVANGWELTPSVRALARLPGGWGQASIWYRKESL